MTPKRWLLVVLGGVALLVLLQRLALLGLVGLERLLIGGLIALENAAVSALTTTARTVRPPQPPPLFLIYFRGSAHNYWGSVVVSPPGKQFQSIQIGHFSLCGFPTEKGHSADHP